LSLIVDKNAIIRLGRSCPIRMVWKAVHRAIVTGWDGERASASRNVKAVLIRVAVTDRAVGAALEKHEYVTIDIGNITVQSRPADAVKKCSILAIRRWLCLNFLSQNHGHNRIR